MSKNSIKDYTCIEIPELILDLCSPDHGQGGELRKRKIPTLTPVDKIHPPIIEPPYSIKDYILGSTKKPKTIYFPSNKDGTPKKWDGEQVTRFKAIDDFNAYAKHYDERVEDIWKRDSANDLISQSDHLLWKRELEPLSPYSFTCSVSKHHFGQSDGFKKDDYGLRNIQNEKIWLIDWHTKPSAQELVQIINKIIYDYIKAVTKGRKLIEGDLYYNPMRELLRWFEVSAIDIESTPNIFEELKKQKAVDVERLFPKIKERTSPRDWEIEHDITKQTLKFTHLGKGGSKKFKYDDCGFNYHKKGETPRRVQLLEHYALWEEMRTESGSTDSATWESCVRISSLKYTQKIQKELSKILKKALNIRGDIFEKLVEKSDGKKYTYFECLIGLTTVSQEKESHKRFTKESQKKSRMKMPSGINDFSRDKKLGRDDIESGVYHYGLDDGDLIDQ